jgi:hypothetical protein
LCGSVSTVDPGGDFLPIAREYSVGFERLRSDDDLQAFARGKS